MVRSVAEHHVAPGLGQGKKGARCIHIRWHFFLSLCSLSLSDFPQRIMDLDGT